MLLVIMSGVIYVSIGQYSKHIEGVSPNHAGFFFSIWNNKFVCITNTRFGRYWSTPKLIFVLHSNFFNFKILYKSKKHSYGAAFSLFLIIKSAEKQFLPNISTEQNLGYRCKLEILL